MGLLSAPAVLLLAQAGSCGAAERALEQGDAATAAAALKDCLRLRPSLDGYLKLCGVYQVLRDEASLYDTAVAALKRFPGEKRFYQTAATYAGRQRRFDEAIRVLQPALQRWPGDAGLGSLLESALVGRGMDHLNAGRNGQAAADLERAAKLAPDDLEALMNLGRALHNLHRPAEAAEVFDRVLKLNPELPLARFHRGMAWQALGEFPRAIEDLSKEIQRNPGYGPSYLARGMAYSSTGEWDKAAKDLEQAVGAMPQDAKPHYALGRAQSQLGRLPEAEAAYRRCMELDPADPGPVNALVRLLVQTGRAAEAAPLRQQAAALAEKQRSAAPGEIRYGRNGATTAQ